MGNGNPPFNPRTKIALFSWLIFKYVLCMRALRSSEHLANFSRNGTRISFSEASPEFQNTQLISDGQTDQELGLSKIQKPAMPFISTFLFCILFHTVNTHNPTQSTELSLVALLKLLFLFPPWRGNRSKENPECVSEFLQAWLYRVDVRLNVHLYISVVSKHPRVISILYFILKYKRLTTRHVNSPHTK